MDRPGVGTQDPINWIWWRTPVVPALRRQGGKKLKAIFSHIVLGRSEGVKEKIMRETKKKKLLCEVWQVCEIGCGCKATDI